jgi:hypothetical protein
MPSINEISKRVFQYRVVKYRPITEVGVQPSGPTSITSGYGLILDLTAFELP